MVRSLTYGKQEFMSQPPEEGWPTLDEPTLVAPPPPPPPPASPPPDRGMGAGMVLALAAIALAAAGIALAYFLTHRNDNPAPTTVVVTTAPATSTVATTASTTTSNATGPVAVPYLIGLTERGAVTRLTDLGLRPKAIFRPTKNTGRIVSQKPRAAVELAHGRTVTLVVDGRPQRQITAPNLVGQTLADAQRKLAALGLHVVVTQVASPQPAGTIIDQAPKPGTKLQKGWDVVLSVARSSSTTTQGTSTGAATTSASTTTATTTSAPPQPTSATMPDVSNQTEQAAVTAMNRVGLLASLFFVPADDPLGTVEQQAKPAGTTLPYHSHVQINISTGPGQKPLMQVPNVVGRTLHDAVSALNSAQLRLIYVKFPVTSGKVGVVVQQSPLAGGRAPKNAQVLVFLAVKR
jgi:beta-lactam-binding protein with PASTA domain